MKTSEEIARIAKLNDECRKTDEIRVTQKVFDSGISIGKIWKKIREVEIFDEDDGGEHDFGSFEIEGQSFVWTINYFSNDLQYASPDPSDASVTKRVIASMTVEEWDKAAIKHISNRNLR